MSPSEKHPTPQVQVVDTEDSDDKSLKTSSPTHDANNANVNVNVNVLERHGSTSGSGYALRDDPQAHGAGRDLDLFDGTLDPVYEAKARVLNRAIQEIGMGRYQVSLRAFGCDKMRWEKRVTDEV